ncbi:hypothetical protein B2G71_10125 [Novosphingobium sp. PC22D]|uniref:GldG family protein n=1 Tax=Novosphingobium sp. PC22D TaxID=1962403 RepID=UPI000BFB11E2|nr:GldG family protein [Novosphingobium sp. PC22D]PEQ12660.1 hypothetical protein B2G71_10125 [Novosphingobium sp. PC22D]
MPNSTPKPNSRRLVRALLAALSLAAACAGCGQASPRKLHGEGTVGLYTSLPIFWPEAGGVADLLATDREAHWALAVLQERGEVVPLDTLANREGVLDLPGDALLVLAQPRPLSPDENVALDRWVRGGGRLLLFVDPLLTAHSDFALGDPRRPQDVALLSPILAHWGLELLFDETALPGEHETGWDGTGIPVNLAGHFRLIPGDARCALAAKAIVAECRLEKGRIVALADAAVLETGESRNVRSRAAALRKLLDHAQNGAATPEKR